MISGAENPWISGAGKSTVKVLKMLY